MAKNNIKAIRKKNTTFTQKDVALILNIPEDTYASYEKGRRNPKQPIKEKIAKLLGCTMDDLNI